MSADWDVESYRSEFESSEHWELKKSFILAHKDKMSEQEIICLAQVFTNIEFLGCRYPDETMMKVAELAKGIVESFREKKKNCLKRTFVAASDAASAKAKGCIASAESTPEKHKYSTHTYHGSQYHNRKNMGIPQTSHPKKFSKSNYRNNSKSDVGNSNLRNSSEEPKIKLKKLTGPFSDFVLFLREDEHPTTLLMMSGCLNKCPISWKHCRENSSFRVYLKNELIGEGKGENHKISKEAAAKDALLKLQKSCYTIKIKAAFASDTAVRPAEISGSSDYPEPKCDIGSKMMKMMGWSGGGLGANQQGIVKPVTLLANLGRSGLGMQYDTVPNRVFRTRANDFIKQWKNSDSDQDLVFTSDFSIQQRKILHGLAVRYSLKSKSYGKGDNRHLVISRKPTPWEILEELARVGGSTSKYDLIIPECSNT